MARKEQPKAPEKRIVTPRFVWRVAVAGALLVSALYAWHKTEQFLIRDARFAMALPDYGLESPSLQIAGVQHVSRVQILRVFAPDYGRSLYLLPLKQRREQLLALDWVKEASIARLWPDRVMVRIQEREPVAFLNVPAENPRFTRVSLIDGEGVILQPPSHARFNLPVAVGIPTSGSVLERRGRVRRLVAFMKDWVP